MHRLGQSEIELLEFLSILGQPASLTEVRDFLLNQGVIAPRINLLPKYLDGMLGTGLVDLEEATSSGLVTITRLGEALVQQWSQARLDRSGAGLVPWGGYATSLDIKANTLLVEWEDVRSPDKVVTAALKVTARLRATLEPAEIVSRIRVVGSGWDIHHEYTEGIVRSVSPKRVARQVCAWDSSLHPLATVVETPWLRLFASATAEFDDAACSLAVALGTLSSLDEKALAIYAANSHARSFANHLRKMHQVALRNSAG